MTVPAPAQENQVQAPEATKQELNFKALKQQLEQEKQARLQAEERAKQLEQNAKQPVADDDDNDSDEPYVDRRMLAKEFRKWGTTIDEKIERKAEEKARRLVEQERQAGYLKSKPDFNNVMTAEVIQKLYTKDPELAETILEMPEGFARQKLVYQTIKSLKLDQPEEKKPTVQEKIDQNRRSPYYQPSGVGAAPYAAQGDFSPAGQKNAYEKLKELKSKLRI